MIEPARFSMGAYTGPNTMTFHYRGSTTMVHIVLGVIAVMLAILANLLLLGVI
jgi:hypothetical protein